MGRPPCCDKSNVKRGLWTAEEDAKMLAYVSTHGTGNWTSVPKKAGLKRCGKSCRLRWTNYLRPDLTRESFTPQEEEVIITLHNTLGSRWSLIAAQLPGRTDNDVKNHWNTKLRKKLLKMGIDPVTHKPISQVVAHYRSIGLPRPSRSSESNPNRSQTSKTAAWISCLNKDLRNAFMPKPQMGFSTPAQYPISNFSMATAMTTEMVPANPDGPFNNEPTWDLLAQLHPMKLVAGAFNQETLQPRMFFEGSSSSSSPSSSSITTTAAPLPFPSQPSQVQDTPSPSSFNWSEFLSEDAFQELSSTDSSSNQMQDVDGMLSPIPQLEFMGGDGFADAGGGVSIDHGNSISEAASGNGNSFVEAILDRESKMLREFPEIQILNDS